MLHSTKVTIMDAIVKPFSGASHDSPRTPNVHISGPRPSKTPPKFHEKTPKREKKREPEREKKREMLGFPPFGAPFLGLGLHPSGPHPSGPHPPFGAPLLHELCLPTTEDGRVGGERDSGLSRTNIYEIFFLALVELA